MSSSARDAARHAREKLRREPAKWDSAAALLGRELPPVEWAVPNILPEGVTILAGAPKMGKSWLSLGLCIAVASGGRALGCIPVEEGRALYLGLEDNDRRMQRRISKMLGGRPCPEKLDYATDWPPLTEGGAEGLREWAGQHPDARLIVIDILKRVRAPEQAGRSMYDVDYESLLPLKPVVEDYGVSILVVHHLRQLGATDALEMISGSSGLTGVADGALILKRDRGEHDALLLVDGRDIEEHAEHALRWDGELASWKLMGDAEEYRLTPERRAVIKLLKKQGPLGPKEISTKTGQPYGSTRLMLVKMLKEGLVTSPRRGLYDVPTTSDNSDNNDNNDNGDDNDNNTPVLLSPPGVVSGEGRADNNASEENALSLGNAANVIGVSGVIANTGPPANINGSEGGPDVSGDVIGHGRRLTTEETERVKRLISQGTKPEIARREVLGEGA